MNKSPTSALQTISCLSSREKTALMDAIAREMTTTIIAISKEIQRGTLDADNTAPFDRFIRTIAQNEMVQQRKLERKLSRYQRRARKWRAERRWIRREFAEMVRRMEQLQRRWKTRVQELEGFRGPGLLKAQTLAPTEPAASRSPSSGSGADSGSGSGQR
ncbi:uncharacterized protein BJX67DRAFT_378846 [Aspergillus lucknowensis]|uniref:BZIP domain-containing protein n=1 Tax=Aspergillus lucknowensis TaxID=176173 RepID=A0ABR4LZG4_9EURO